MAENATIVQAERQASSPVCMLRDLEKDIARKLADVGKAVRGELGGVRERIRELLASSPFLDMMEYIEQLHLAEQFEEETARLRHFGFLTGDALPPFSLDQLVRNMSPKQLEVACRFPDPTLLVYPKVPLDAEVQAIDAHRNADQMKTYVNQDEFTFGVESEQNNRETDAWSWRIVEGTKEVQPASWDDVSKVLSGRAMEARKMRHPLARGMDQHAYAHLGMRNLRAGAPVDQRTWTIFDDDKAKSPSQVLGGYWDLDQVFFDAFRAGDPYGLARFRSSVGGDVHLG